MRQRKGSQKRLIIELITARTRGRGAQLHWGPLRSLAECPPKLSPEGPEAGAFIHQLHPTPPTPPLVEDSLQGH